MKNVIIGTAGHIDHGKTTLIRALTGMNTDRLKEEQKRGISIDLGFTHFDLPSGKRAGIIDVPGHEKFIKNMLAGVSGMDLVMLVVAADEGVMPQTMEHLEILNFLDIEKGIVVLTKCDNVDDELMEIVEEDLKEQIKDTFLANAPVIQVDSISKRGMDELKKKIDELVEEVEERNLTTNPRLYIDRSFSVKGFGTIVTGTLIEGTLRVGDDVVIYPGEIESKIRTLQVHGEDSQQAFAGQRTAVNLANVKKEDVKRGDVLSVKESLEPTMMVDCKFKLMKNIEKPLQYWERIRFYHGTGETLGRIAILENDEIHPGQDAYIQLRLESPIVVKQNDKFVIRRYSPMETVGGGYVIDPNPKKHRKMDGDVVESLKLKEKGSLDEIISELIRKEKTGYYSIKDIARLLGEKDENLKPAIAKLVEEKQVFDFNGIYMHVEKYTRMMQSIKETLQKYHSANLLRKGMLKEELRTRIEKKLSNKEFYSLLEEAESTGEIKIDGNYVSKLSFEVRLTPQDIKLKTKIEGSLLEDRYSPRKIWDVIPKNQHNMDLVEFMNEDTIIKVEDELYFNKSVYDEAVDKMSGFIAQNENIQLAQFRDLIGGSRKYCMILLDDFDKRKITRKIEDNKRILY